MGRRSSVPLSFLFKVQERDGCLKARDNNQIFLASQEFLRVGALTTLQIFNGDEINLASEIRNKRERCKYRHVAMCALWIVSSKGCVGVQKRCSAHTGSLQGVNVTAQLLFSRWCFLKASFLPVSVAFVAFLLLPVNLCVLCGCERWHSALQFTLERSFDSAEPLLWRTACCWSEGLPKAEAVSSLLLHTQHHSQPDHSFSLKCQIAKCQNHDTCRCCPLGWEAQKTVLDSATLPLAWIHLANGAVLPVLTGPGNPPSAAESVGKAGKAGAVRQGWSSGIWRSHTELSRLGHHISLLSWHSSTQCFELLRCYTPMAYRHYSTGWVIFWIAQSRKILRKMLIIYINTGLQSGSWKWKNPKLAGLENLNAYQKLSQLCLLNIVVFSPVSWCYAM